MELYHASTDSWARLNTVPDLTFSSMDDIYVHICAYHRGYIYVTFSQNRDSGYDRRIHVYDTWNDLWSVSDSRVRTEAYFPVSAVVP